MGIKGLSTFMNTKFQGWQDADFKKWSHLVIDGNNICYQLYRKHYNWLLGGEYCKFYHSVVKFFEEAQFNHPIVVFDGADYDKRKLDTTRERRKRAMDDMHRVQAKGGWELTGIRENAAPLPLMLIATFIDALQSIKGIEVCVVKGEADNVIAGLANHHKCPVLSSDSDFFVFNLEHGFVHFERYYEGRSDSLFTIKAFMSQFLLKTYEMCLLIPATFGNDFIKLHQDTKPQYGLFLEKLAEYDSSDDFLSNGVHSNTVKKFENAKEQYCDTPCTGKMPPFNVPPWVLENLKCGHFPPCLLSLRDEKCFLPRVVEVIKEESAWKCSKHIRQYLYGFMDLPKGARVNEVIREDCFPKLEESLTTQTHFRKNPVNISHDCFASHNKQILRDLVLVVLKCPKKEEFEEAFNQLDDKWKLPLAATYYWYQKQKAKNIDLLKSLLLSFFTCSGIISNDVPLLPSVNPGNRVTHLTALHAFAQWQCVYHDTRALNYLAREPFPTTSTAFLYSGEVAMHYATIVPHREDWLAGVIQRESYQWELINRFLHYITGCPEEGKSTANGWTVVEKK